MNPTKGYGAVNLPEGGGEEYDEKNTYYLNEKSCSWNRFFRAAVPIIIALFIVGGFGYGMSHGHLIGEPKHTGDNRAKHDSSKDSNKRHGSGDTLCSVNPKCKQLELTGYCCPTGSGVMLGCCN